MNNKIREYVWEYNKLNKGRSELEIYRTLYVLCCKIYNELKEDGKKRTERKDAVLTTSPQVVCMLQTLGRFKLDDSIDFSHNPHKVGTIGNFDVYRDMTAKNNSISITAFYKQSTIKVKGI